jgi:hypothetical protein
MKHMDQQLEFCCKHNPSAIPWLLRIFAIAVFIGLGPASECWALTTSPTALTFNAVQGESNPPSETLSVYRSRTNQITLAGSDNASWLTVSPATVPMTNTAQLTVAVDTNGLAAGTYNATITIRVGKRVRTTVPVTLTVSPSTQPPPSATTAILAWSPVADPTLSGYKIYVGTASGLYTQTITVGNLTSYTVGSLAMGTTYYFAVTAYNSAGESTPSNEVSKSIY